MHGSDRVPDLRDYKRAWVGKGKPFNESEMALFSECSLECARKVLDTADIVREAMFRQLSESKRKRTRDSTPRRASHPPARQSHENAFFLMMRQPQRRL